MSLDGMECHLIGWLGLCDHQHVKAHIICYVVSRFPFIYFGTIVKVPLLCIFCSAPRDAPMHQMCQINSKLANHM